MISINKIVGPLIGFLTLAGTCSANELGFVSPGDAAAILQSFADDISTTLSTSIPVVLGIAGALFGVYLLIRFARRTIK